MGVATSIAFLAGLCVVLAVVLAVAYRKLWVYEDPRIDRVTDLLPGANCGACGLPGCRLFAEKVVGGEIQPGQCTVGGPDTASFVADYLGIDAGSMEKRVARLLCAGGTDVSTHAGHYEGFQSCRAAATIGGGFKGCTYGCLGLDDCEVACTFDAIVMSATKLPVVDLEACTACGDCVDACPKDLFVISPISHHLVVQCKSLLAGDEAEELCQVACTGCGICAADGPEGLIEMKDNLPVLDLNRIDLQTEIATLRCPTRAIQWVEGQQFQELVDRPAKDLMEA